MYDWFCWIYYTQVSALHRVIFFCMVSLQNGLHHKLTGVPFQLEPSVVVDEDIGQEKDHPVYLWFMNGCLCWRRGLNLRHLGWHNGSILNIHICPCMMYCPQSLTPAVTNNIFNDRSASFIYNNVHVNGWPRRNIRQTDPENYSKYQTLYKRDCKVLEYSG